MAAIEIKFNDLLDVLSRVFDIPEDGRKALTSRLKHLQGKSFPPGVNVGRGGRVHYDIDAVMGVVLVMALTSAYIPPNQGVELVRSNWIGWRELLSAAARARLRPQPWSEQPTEEMVAIIESNALADLGAATPSEGRSAGLRGALAFRKSVRGDGALGNGLGRGAATIVDVPAVLAVAAPAIAAVAKCDVDDVHQALVSP